jgi:hypothetical protein
MKRIRGIILFLFPIMLTFCQQRDLWKIAGAEPLFYISVLSTAPSAGELLVPASRTIDVCFSDNIDMSSVNASTFHLDNGVTASAYNYNNENKKVELVPSAPLSPDTTYTATLTRGIVNPAGEGLYADFSWSFTTAPSGHPEIDVLADGLPVSSYGFLDYGNLLAGASRVARFRIINSGTADLNVSVATGGADAAQFTLDTAGMTSPVTPSAYTEFTVAYSPSATGVHSAGLIITSDDSDEGSFLITLEGIALASGEPEISLMQGGKVIPSPDGRYSFGTVLIGQSSPAVAFRIMNLGSGDLCISDIYLSGEDASLFSLDDSATAYTVAADDYTEFTISFSPVAKVNAQALVTISNNDPDEGAYIFRVTGRANK